MNILNLIGREKELFVEEIGEHELKLKEIVSVSRFLVIGGAGSIGQAVNKEIFKRNPNKLHVVDEFGLSAVNGGIVAMMNMMSTNMISTSDRYERRIR